MDTSVVLNLRNHEYRHVSMLFLLNHLTKTTTTQVMVSSFTSKTFIKHISHQQQEPFLQCANKDLGQTASILLVFANKKIVYEQMLDKLCH